MNYIYLQVTTAYIYLISSFKQINLYFGLFCTKKFLLC